ncbi:MAG TPA: M20/M25/M40 family metallo-hydrolase [Jatrophihabitans sp.]|nr:M20/M25/M40 family metallo-hydrolase [Jatrophihabitans sp.]
MLDLFRSQTAAMVDELGELVGCESPSRDPAALERSADLVAALGADVLGSAPERLVVGDTPHLRWRFGAAPSQLLILAHHDTVWPLGTLRSMPWQLDDYVARGPGCFDMKAGLVLAWHAMAAQPDLTGVCLLVVGDEEIGSPTAAALIDEESRGCRAVLVTEPSADGGQLKTARAGLAQYEVTITGRAAHAGLEPERGVNAAVELAGQVLAVAALGGGDATVTPTVLAAGTTVNTVPAAARLAVDVRATTSAAMERIDDALRTLRPTHPEASVDVDRVVYLPPLEAERSAALAALAGEVAGRLGLPPVGGTAVRGASDGNRTAANGIPTLDGLGAVGGGAHAASEHVRIDRLADRAALLAGLIGELSP